MSAQLPDDLHALKGTRATRAVTTGYDVPAGRPAFPKGISKDAKKVFKALVKELESRRALTTGDVQILHVLAELQTRWARARAKLAAEGEIRMYTRLDSNGNAHEQEKPNLWLKVAETCERNIVACLDRLGLTPINRAKVKPTGAPEPKPSAPPAWLTQPEPAEPQADLLADFDLKDYPIS